MIFDLGGVLVQLTGVDTLRAWLQHRCTADALVALTALTQRATHSRAALVSAGVIRM